jgi:hypothetical protein
VSYLGNRKRAVLLVSVLGIAALAAAVVVTVHARTSSAAALVNVESIDVRELPPDIRSGVQPSQDAGGVSHTIRTCELADGHLKYIVDFNSPYDRGLRSIIALSIDDASGGLGWGWFRAQLPSGDARVVVDSRRAPDGVRKDLAQSLERIDLPMACSAHLLGFLEGATFKVSYPVSSKSLDD